MAEMTREERRLEELLRKRRLAEQRADLRARKVYIPQMNYSGSRALAAVLRSVGIDADVSPDDNREAFDLAGRYLSGDECLPERVTLGGFLKVLTEDGLDPKRVAFFMPTAGGPCRFGQYRTLVRKILSELGYEHVLIVSPSSSDGYEGIVEASTELIRTAWWAVVTSDTLMKMLHRTRPYELNKGDTDEVFERGTDLLCKVLEQRIPLKEKFNLLRRTMEQIRDEFRAIPTEYDPERPLIGVVGEIFCRMNTFSNEDLIRKVEELGGECWLSDVSEWIWYTNRETIKRIIDSGKRFSMDMIIERIKTRIQRRDEHHLLEPFKEDLRGYEEPEDINVILEFGLPYLPVDGALGEMVLSVGKAVYLYHKGADGIIDISPFTCMNGIASEAVYPHLSRDHDNIPIKNFYFDGTLTDLERDLGIFLELARNYQKRKRVKRVYPKCFGVS
jgi:predicted nucleotide-binding protein (sugar kinase/HSP70/actin superfamily)